ncbi:MAG: hypothetical protein R3A52_27545 [Polyangiales bacterium]
MYLPHSNAAPGQLARYGTYLNRRLRRAGMKSLADAGDRATAALVSAARALEDAEGPVQAALADRDAADDALDLAAQELRHALASRAIDAVKKAPYTQVFPNGIDYYTAATLSDEVPRYRELLQRLEAHLPAADPARKRATQAITAALKDFEAASAALTEARNARALADTALADASEAWRRQVEKTYGAAVSELGRKRAEGFFPRARKARPTATPSTPDKEAVPNGG